MATRSLIGSVQDNGTIKTIYCHWDGYPDYNGEILLSHYTTPRLVDELIEGGDLSSLDFDYEHCNPYSARGDKWELIQPREVEWKDLAEVTYDCNAEYVYIYNSEYEWECYEYDYGTSKLNKIKILADVA